MNRKIGTALGAALLLGIAAPAGAEHRSTTNLVAAIAQDGRVMDEWTARRLVKDLRDDGVAEEVIREVLGAVLGRDRGRDRGRDDRPEVGERGMGEFVRAAKARGLRGRSLARAIHDELARRGVPGQARRDHPVFGDRGRGPGHGRGEGHGRGHGR